jgi:hypothetical protein
MRAMAEPDDATGNDGRNAKPCDDASYHESSGQCVVVVKNPA